MHRLRAFAGTMVTSILLATAGFAQESGFSIATGAKDGNYYSVGGALCRLVNGRGQARCAIRESEGSIDGIYALRLGDVDFALVQSDVQQAAYDGSPGIEDTPLTGLRAVFSIYPETMAIVVPARSPIQTFEDIAGARVYAGTPRSGTRFSFEAMVAAAGIDPAAVTLAPADPGQGAESLCGDRIDVLFAMTGQPSAFLNRLSETCMVRLVPVGAETIAALTDASPAYRAGIIPAEFYDMLDADVPTVGTVAALVTMADAPDAQVMAILDAVFEDYGAFRRQHLALGEPTPADAALTAPMHDAARRFFRRKGLMQ